MTRAVTHHYQDPLDAIWIVAAKRMGLTVVRGPETYATTDGAGTLTLTDDEGMDPDDCLAQMIFHEICHWLVQGPQSLGWVDWGLDNEGTRDTELEHACLRLQAALLAPHGLRRALAPTTDFRTYYDNLPADPFAERSPGERECIIRARVAYGRRRHRPWKDHLGHALKATASLMRQTKQALGDAALESSLFALVEQPQALGAVGLPEHHDEDLTCESCAWAYEGGPGKKVWRCKQASGARMSPSTRACERFEPTFDCLSCGACCREAYDTVEVSPRDPLVKVHLHLLEERRGGYDMKREGGRCTCLRGGTALSPPSPSISGGTASPDEAKDNPPLYMPGGAPFTCSIYEERPRTCREFTIFSEHCLSARRAVGLSR